MIKKFESRWFDSTWELVFGLRGKVSKETVVLRRWESMAGNLVLTTELKT